MKTKLYILLSLAVSLFFQACETDFDLTADWKETTIIYGVLSQNQKVQNIRINKAFLGDGNAMQYSQNPDSINFDTADIRARIDEYYLGSFMKSYQLRPVWIDRQYDTSSVFYNPNKPQILVYQTLPYSKFGIDDFTKDTIWLNPNSVFYLVVKNIKRGTEIKSFTPLVSDFNISKPNINPNNPIINIKDSESSNSVKWKAAKNGKRAEAIYRFYYKEFTNSTDTVIKYCDFALGTFKSDRTDGTEEFETSFKGNSFHTTLTNQIPFNANVKREAYRIQLIFTVIADEFNIYLDVNAPSSGIVQERPEYSNIENGLGIFSSRYQKTRMAKIGPNMEADIVSRFNKLDGSFRLSSANK